MRAAPQLPPGALLYSIIIRPVKNEGGRNTAGEHALITITDSTGGGFFTLDSLDQLDTMFDRIDQRTAHAIFDRILPHVRRRRREATATSQVTVTGNYVGSLPQGVFHGGHPAMIEAPTSAIISSHEFAAMVISQRRCPLELFALNSSTMYSAKLSLVMTAAKGHK